MKVEVGQVRMSHNGAQECDVNEALKAAGWYVCRTRTRSRHGGPLCMLSESQVLESYPQVVLPNGG